MPESGLPFHIASCDLELDLQESGQVLEIRSTGASRKPSQSQRLLLCSPVPALPLGQPLLCEGA